MANPEVFIAQATNAPRTPRQKITWRGAAANLKGSRWRDGKWINALDAVRFQAGLNQETWGKAQEPEAMPNKKTEKMSVLGGWMTLLATAFYSAINS